MTRIKVSYQLESNEFYANIHGQPHICASGRTKAEAIGQLILTWPHLFKVEIRKEGS